MKKTTRKSNRIRPTSSRGSRSSAEKYVPLPKRLKDLSSAYGALVRELSKR